MSKLTQYLQRSEIPFDEDPLEWSKTYNTQFSVLSLPKYLCISATRLPSEKVLNCAGNIVTDQRSCLTPVRAEQLFFLSMNRKCID